ncbi:MAG: hypothetical protein M3247_05560 [Thermoproteota archaeon]|nr:hypothetical protein [Acidobacteriota bacterium]MDQ3903086.1 hypothetical protein [Thermoproteota archaeon]
MSSERFVRWQSNTLNQLSFAINLFLGLATAALGFCVSLLIDEKFVPSGRAKYLFTLALFCQMFSLFFGIVAVITRTLDFRFTARIARNVEKSRDEAQTELLRRRVKKLGRITWFSFWAEIGFFVLGILSLITHIMITYSQKLL